MPTTELRPRLLPGDVSRDRKTEPSVVLGCIGRSQWLRSSYSREASIGNSHQNWPTNTGVRHPRLMNPLPTNAGLVTSRHHSLRRFPASRTCPVLTTGRESAKFPKKAYLDCQRHTKGNRHFCLNRTSIDVGPPPPFVIIVQSRRKASAV
jgi:hypothetical protein